MEIISEYPIVRRAVRVIRSCIIPEQKLAAIQYAKLAIEKDIQPKTKKKEDIVKCELEKDSIYKFICSLAGDKCNQTDFVENSGSL